MGNGNRVGDPSAERGKEYCDVGLGLKMQNNTDSYPCTKTMTVLPSTDSPYHHHQHQRPSPENSSFVAADYGGSFGGGPMFSIYDAAASVNSAAASASVLPFTTTTTDAAFKYTGGGGGGGVAAAGGAMAATGKVLFTTTQWQELERQTIIYKYIMASIPVPPELLFSHSSKTPISSHPVSQSNTAGFDLRFSSGSDPEPWRCRRTDGKKWRCSRDVAPDQKYCDRHAHKSRPRSRKPVEIQSHNTTTTNAAASPAAVSHRPPPTPPSDYNLNATTATSFQRSQFPSMVSAASPYYHHQPTRRVECTEWFMESGTIPFSSSSQQFQESMQWTRVGSKGDHDKDLSFFQEEHEIDDTHMSYNHDPYHLSSGTTPSIDTKRHFIDGWSRGGARGEREEENKCLLTLSMQPGGNGNGIDGDGDGGGFGVGVVNTAAWMGSAPGGPLGEALCLGTSGNVKSSAHGNSNSTTSSCEDICHIDGGGGFSFTR